MLELYFMLFSLILYTTLSYTFGRKILTNEQDSIDNLIKLNIIIVSCLTMVFVILNIELEINASSLAIISLSILNFILSTFISVFIVAYERELKDKTIYKLKSDSFIIYIIEEDIVNHIKDSYEVKVEHLKSTKANLKLLNSKRNKELIETLI